MTEHDLEILAKTIYGEARGELNKKEGGVLALVAVANVVMNRLLEPHRYGKSIADVCLKKFQFSCWNSGDPNCEKLKCPDLKKDPLYQKCLKVATNVSMGIWPDVTHGANHYYAQWLKNAPHWAKDKKPTTQIGSHLFFKLN